METIYRVFIFIFKLSCLKQIFENIIWRPTETNKDIGDQWRPLIEFSIFNF